MTNIFGEFEKKRALSDPGAGRIPSLATPTFQQLEWQDSELGVIFHFDISIGTEHIRGDVRQLYNPADYNPLKLDTDQWVLAAKNAGATYAFFTATHFGGFLQWQSDLYPYGLKQASWKNGQGDLVADFIMSCHKYNIRPCLYLSTHRNAYWQVEQHFVNWGEGKGSERQNQYNRMCEGMIHELFSRYGSISQVWFDAGVKSPGEGGPDVVPIFERYQPHILFYNSSQRADFRWIGNERGLVQDPCWATMPEGPHAMNSANWRDILGSGTHSGNVWAPAMADTPLRSTDGVHGWFWSPNQEHGIYSVGQLMDIYERTVGRNCNMVLGVVIDQNGLVPQPDVQRLEEFGKAMKQQYWQKLVATAGRGNILTITLKNPGYISRYVAQEEIAFGERVESFVVTAQTEKGDWVEIERGTSIGHKRIGKCPGDKKFVSVRLQVIRSKAEPVIREFAVYQSANAALLTSAGNEGMS